MADITVTIPDNILTLIKTEMSVEIPDITNAQVINKLKIFWKRETYERYVAQVNKNSGEENHARMHACDALLEDE